MTTKRSSTNLLLLALRLVINLCLWIIAGVIMSLLMDCLGIAMLGHHSGLLLIRHLMLESMQYIHESNTVRLIMISLPNPLTGQSVSWITWLPSGLQANAAHIYIALFPYINAVIFGLHLIVLRLALLWSQWLPFFGLITWVAAGDGLVCRQIRRYRIARESASTYEQYSNLTAFSLIGTTVFFLTMPIPLHPMLLFCFVGYLCYGISLQKSIKHYKKYY